MLVEPVGLLATEPEQVAANFTQCGKGNSFACVVDGDTFRLGPRRIRIIGIDAPETHPPGCAEEARLGAEATAKLRVLLNQGPFTMVGSVTRNRDRYERELRAIQRTGANGATVSIAAQMRDAGLARRYMGGFRLGWC